MLKTCAAFLLIVLATLFTPAAVAEEATPADVAKLFFAAFEQKDLDTVASLFAPGALVQRARLTDAEPEFAHFDAQEWAASAGEGISGIQSFKLEVLDVRTLAFADGTTVSVLFRATGEVAENVSFVNDGVDSLSMTKVDGKWRILLYSSMEKLSMAGGG